jgi:hypothetical protein
LDRRKLDAGILKEKSKLYLHIEECIKHRQQKNIKHADGRDGRLADYKNFYTLLYYSEKINNYTYINNLHFTKIFFWTLSKSRSDRKKQVERLAFLFNRIVNQRLKPSLADLWLS